MSRHIYLFRLCRNILISFFSAAWVIPLTGSLKFIYNYMRAGEIELFKVDYPTGPPYSYIKISQSFLSIAEFLLIITIFFWAFVAANRLWPIKGKKKGSS